MNPDIITCLLKNAPLDIVMAGCIFGASRGHSMKGNDALWHSEVGAESGGMIHRHVSLLFPIMNGWSAELELG